jgi:NADPH:quinone reductase-like Zn-dependent oxidoreductase
VARVVLATAYGGPEVLEVVDEEPGEPGPGEVLLEVRAAGVNPADWKRYSGAWGADPSQLPIRLGYEAAGVVAAAGPDAAGPAGPVSVGDEVIAFRIAGAYAERIVVGADTVVPRPAALSWEQAGGLLLAGATAVHTLVATGVGDGDTVLIHGASGGVGSLAVQLAHVRGAARIIGTAAERNHEFLRSLGAEPVTYGPGLADRVRALAPDGVDASIDTVGTDEAIDVSLELTPDRGRVATIAAFARGGREGIRLLGGGPGADAGEPIRAAARLDLVRLADEGRLTVETHPYALDDVADAHRASMGGHARGKIVLVA